MLSKILIGGVAAAVIVGAGGAALATTTGGSSSDAAQAKQSQSHRHGGQRLLRHLDHADIVIDTKKHGDVTHQLIRGTVTAVSSSSITVVSADKTTETFTVNKDTKVGKRVAGTGAHGTKGARRTKPAKATISEVATGDHVFVSGVGATDPVARHILDRGTS